MKLITPELEARFAELGDQSGIKKPLIIAVFFVPLYPEKWYVTEYNPETRICYGYVKKSSSYQWKSFSIDELESIERPFIPVMKDGIEYSIVGASELTLHVTHDSSFKEQTFDELFSKKDKDRLSELPKNKEEQERER